MNKLVVMFIFSLIISSCNNWKPSDDETYLLECYKSKSDSAFCECTLNQIKVKFSSLEEALKNEEKLPEIFLECN